MASCSSSRSRRRAARTSRSEEHTSELQSQSNVVCRLLLEKTNKHRMRRLARRTHVLSITSLGDRAALATAHFLAARFAKLSLISGGLYHVEPDIHVLSPLP